MEHTREEVEAAYISAPRKQFRGAYEATYLRLFRGSTQPQDGRVLDADTLQTDRSGSDDGGHMAITGRATMVERPGRVQMAQSQ